MTTRYGRFALRDGSTVFARVDGESLRVQDAAPWLGGKETGVVQPSAETTRLCPVTPSKILCIGRNYHAHVKEMGGELPKEPLLFLKPTSSLLDPGGVVILPPESSRVEHESELGVVIAKKGRRIPVERAMEHVLGYTIVGDITARDLQKSDGQWSRAKGFDTFCPVGPDIVAGVDPCALSIRGRVNGQTRQDGNTRDMIFDVARLVSHLSQAMTLEAGDLIATGTPEGVGPLVDGDVFEIEIESLGTLRVTVRREGA
ncbi:MAG: fumarylacetoacetate hydrolase family protein [Deltaproteobacteria bacterium]|nr:fumarylacetoacetate hydrolase family protein [Deltaproteobacteria bacterium]